MTLQEWLEKTFTHITLVNTIASNGTILNVPSINIELTSGIISTNSIDEFSKLAFHYAPVGTIIEPLDQDWYDTKVLAVRNMLTKKLLTEPKAKILLDILERRDKEHWTLAKASNTLDIKQDKNDNTLNITFTSM